MPTIRIPLVGTFNQRGMEGNADLTISEDQRFLNCRFDVVKNPVTGKATVYVEKRPGWSQDSVVSTGIASTGLIKPQQFAAPISAFGDTNSNVYLGTINVGVITGRALHFTETLISNSTHVEIKSSDGTGWYYADGAKNVTSYSGRISTSSFIIIEISSTAGFFSGQLVTGTGIGAGARVTSINAAASTIGVNVTSATASTSTITITKEPIAKILSANFVASSTYQSAFAPMDGYLFYATDDGYINNSDLNTDIVYSSNARLAVQTSPDPPVAVAVQKNTVVVLGLNSKEVFYNAGLASGSPLKRIPQAAERIGCLDQRSVTTIEDRIYFVATPYEGDVGVYVMAGGQAQRISTPVVDRILGTIATNGAIYANSFRLGGYPYVGIYCSLASDGPSSMLLLESGDHILLETGDDILLEDTPAQIASFVRFMVYNIDLNIWSEWDCNQATFIDSVGSGTNNQVIATSRTNTSGKIYKIDPASGPVSFTDDTSTYSLDIRTSRLDLGTSDRKYIEEVALIADTVTSAAASTVSLYWSDDDYQSWKGPLYFDLTQRKKNVHRLGSHYEGRAYRLVHSANGPFRAEALEIRYRKGLS